MELLSIIVPCFNEEAAVEQFFARASAVCAGLPDIRVEYIFARTQNFSTKNRFLCAQNLFFVILDILTAVHPFSPPAVPV